MTTIIVISICSWILAGILTQGLWQIFSDNPPPFELSLAAWPFVILMLPFELVAEKRKKKKIDPVEELHRDLDRLRDSFLNHKKHVYNREDSTEERLNKLEEPNDITTYLQILNMIRTITENMESLSAQVAYNSDQTPLLSARIRTLEDDLEHQKTRAETYKQLYLEKTHV